MALPKLRFKEFGCDWENSCIKNSDILVIDGDRGENYPKLDEFTPHGFCLFLNAGNVTKEGFNFENTQFISYEKDCLLRKGKLVRNDVVMTTRGTLGNVAFYDKKVNFKNVRINSGMVILRSRNKVLPLYLNYFLNTPKFDNWLLKNAFGSAQPQLTIKLISSLEITYPQLEEQTKIANFLTAVDEKISQLNEQHQLMIQYKKGVMQKIFSQEIRFKDDNGKEFGEWEERILEDVSIIIMGSSPKSENYNELGIGLPLLQGNADIKNRKSCPRNFTTEITKECDVGDILMSVRAPVGYVAKAMHDACIGRGIAAIRVKENNNQEFLYQYLIYMEDIWGKFSQGSTFDSVNSEQIKKLSLFIPCLQEQTKIADFLTKLDDKIEKLALQLEQVKMWKKGLLQLMFV